MVLERGEKGREAEQKFKDWLDNNNIPYIYISQEINDFSPAFGKFFSGKRPDFIILVPNFGLIFVDIKSRDLSQEFDTLPIHSEDFIRYSSIHNTFNIPIWFVISNEQFDYKNWFWISVAKLQNLNLKEKTSSVSKESFIPIHKSYFTEISDTDSLGRLFEDV